MLELAAGAGRVPHTRGPLIMSGSTASPFTRVILQPLERGPGLRRALRPGPSSSTTSLVYPSSPPKSSKHGPGTPRVKPFCCLPVGDDGVRFPWAAHATPMQIPRGTRNERGWSMGCQGKGAEPCMPHPLALLTRQALAASASRLRPRIWDTLRRRKLDKPLRCNLSGCGTCGWTSVGR